MILCPCRKEPVTAWEELVDPKKAHLATEDAIDLVGKLLKYDHQVSKSLVAN